MLSKSQQKYCLTSGTANDKKSVESDRVMAAFTDSIEDRLEKKVQQEKARSKLRLNLILCL